MVANAGICITKPIVESEYIYSSSYIMKMPHDCMSLASSTDFQRILDVNVIGTYLCYKYAAQQMIQQGRGGRIIGASSLAGKQGIFALILLYG